MDLEHGSGSTKHVKPIDGSVSIKQPETQLEFVIASGNIKKLEDVDGSDRNKFSTPKMSSSSSSSLSSSSSSDLPTDHLQVDTNECTKSETDSTDLPEQSADTQPTIIDVETSPFSDSSLISEELDISPLDPGLTSQASESKVHDMPYPPVQTMERVGGYDPHRIPSSVFEISKSTTPMEWSVASNESLFSIHVGNSSFSRDNFFLFNDLPKSGELNKSGEVIMSSPPVPVSSPAPEIERKSPEVVKESAAFEGLKQKIIKDTTMPTAEDSSVKRAPVALGASSISSNGSAASTRSFAFPITKKKKSAWRSCYCSNCSWAFCYFRWPRCHFARPRCHFSWPSCLCCSNCSRAFCYGWNCSKIRMCCQSPSILPGGLKSESIRPENEQLHPDKPVAKWSLKSSVKSWFPCFSWCSSSWCCSWHRYCCACC